jgi:secreted trypsin-like serine protease
VPVTAVCDRLLLFGDATHRGCLGDSGGPLLTTDATGAEVVAAVVSFYDGTQCGPPVYAVRVDPYAAWLDSIVAGSADTTCASTCPPKGAACADDAGAPVDASGEAGAHDGASGGGSAGCSVAAATRANGCGALAAMLALVVALALRRRVT